jgi:hypothetical protein
MTDAATQTSRDGTRVSAASALPDPGLSELFPAGRAPWQARAARGQILIRDGRPAGDSPAPSGRNWTRRTFAAICAR